MMLAIMDARRTEERLGNQLTEADFFTKGQALKDLERIRKRYNIQIDQQLFNSD